MGLNMYGKYVLYIEEFIYLQRLLVEINVCRQESFKENFIFTSKKPSAFQ